MKLFLFFLSVAAAIAFSSAGHEHGSDKHFAEFARNGKLTKRTLLKLILEEYVGLDAPTILSSKQMERLSPEERDAHMAKTRKYRKEVKKYRKIAKDTLKKYGTKPAKGRRYLNKEQYAHGAEEYIEEELTKLGVDIHEHN